MTEPYYRDPVSGALINNNASAYNARVSQKNNAKKLKAQEVEITDLKTQLADLKAIVDTLTGE